MNRTDRLMAIVLLLRTRRKLTALQLADIFEVSIRTIYRDVDSLCQAGVPIAVELGPEGGYSLLETYSLPPVMFTLDEAVALFLSSSFIARCRGMPFQDALKTALIKIEDILPEELRESVHVTSESILFDGIEWRGAPVAAQVFTAVNEAMRKCECLHMIYHGARRDEVTEREVAPYGLIYDYRNGMWYLVGFCHLRHEQRMFRLDRIQEISLTGRAFEVPPEFDLERLAGRSWAQAFAESLKQDHPRIRVKVTQEVSERLRQDWLLRYAGREETPDGKVILTYHGHIPSGLLFLYRFGADCEVLEPKELRDGVVEEAKWVLALYGG